MQGTLEVPSTIDDPAIHDDPLLEPRLEPQVYETAVYFGQESSVAWEMAHSIMSNFNCLLRGRI